MSFPYLYERFYPGSNGTASKCSIESQLVTSLSSFVEFRVCTGGYSDHQEEQGGSYCKTIVVSNKTSVKSKERLVSKDWCLPCTWTERRNDGWMEGDPRAVQRRDAELMSQLLGKICVLSLIAVVGKKLGQTLYPAVFLL